MKPVPPHITASGPTGTEWFGGAVDRSTMTLRVMAKVKGGVVDHTIVSRLLARESDQRKFKHWSLSAPVSEESDLDGQADWILSRLSADRAAWERVLADYSVDLFCGLFLERANRGVSLSPRVLSELAARGIELGFDIYAPETSKEPSQATIDDQRD